MKSLDKELIKKKINPSLCYALKQFWEKLFQNDISKKEEKNYFLSNILLEFRSGVILTAILKKEKLIAKNISNCPTIEIERLNELLTGRHLITLNEDIHNTLMLNKLSLALLSRMSVIYIDEYNVDEQKIVLNNYILENNLNISPKDLNILLDFVEKYKNKIGNDFSLNKIINTIRIISQMNSLNKEQTTF